MKDLGQALNKVIFSFTMIVKHLLSIERFIVKTDEQDFEFLLKKDKDKITFKKEVDRMLKENIKSSEVEINNRKIKILL